MSEYRISDSDPTRGVLILDAAENWFDGYGLSSDVRPSYFVEALRGVGSLLGIGSTFEQVPGTASGSNPLLYNATLFPLQGGTLPTTFSIEPDFLSSNDLIPGQALHRPEISDVDLYRFSVQSAGTISIETFAQRLDNASLLNTDLKLWKLNSVTGQYELVARNDDFYSLDSFVGIEVSPNANGSTAVYVLGVTASGNDDYNPNLSGTGSGGMSQGAYQMRVTFQNKNVSTIKDANGSSLDGDANGTQGGDFISGSARPKQKKMHWRARLARCSWTSRASLLQTFRPMVVWPHPIDRSLMHSRKRGLGTLFVFCQVLAATICLVPHRIIRHTKSGVAVHQILFLLTAKRSMCQAA